MSIATELAAIRAATDVGYALPNDARVLRYAQTLDGFGGSGEAWVPDVAHIKVRLGETQPAQPIDLGGRLVDKSDDIHVSYPQSAILHLKDRLVIDGQTYEVQSIDDVNDWSIFNQCWVVPVGGNYTMLSFGAGITFTGVGPIFQFDQPTPSTTWVIPHMLGHYPVSIIIRLTDGSFTEADRIDSDVNDTTLTFTNPQSGTAYLI